MAVRTLSWSKLLGSFVAVIAAFAVVNVIVYYSSTYFAQDRAYQIRVDEFTTRPHAHVLFLGDSKTAALRNTYLAETTYNASFGGDSLRECYIKLRYLLQRSSRIDTVIVSADLSMFSTGRVESSNRTFADRYLLLSDPAFLFSSAGLSALRQQVPLFNDDFVQYLRKSMVEKLTGPHTEHRDAAIHAHAWAELPRDEQYKRAHSTGTDDHAGLGESARPIEWYKRLVALAHEHGIKIVAVRYPGDSAYFEMVTQQQVASIDSALKSIGIADLLDLRFHFADAIYFTDEDHVNQKGAFEVLRLLEHHAGVTLLKSPPREPQSVSTAQHSTGS